MREKRFSRPTYAHIFTRTPTKKIFSDLFLFSGGTIAVRERPVRLGGVIREIREHSRVQKTAARDLVIRKPIFRSAHARRALSVFY